MERDRKLSSLAENILAKATPEQMKKIREFMNPVLYDDNKIYDSTSYGAPFTTFSEFCPDKEDLWFNIRDEEALFRGAKRYKRNDDLHALFLFFIAMTRGYRLEGRDVFDISRVQILGRLR